MLDVIGSMSGEKIDRLYEAVVKMVNTLDGAGFKLRTGCSRLRYSHLEVTLCVIQS